MGEGSCRGVGYGVGHVVTMATFQVFIDLEMECIFHSTQEFVGCNPESCLRAAKIEQSLP